jgi:septal ring factor EnvC (AmiA/AmiB activator)
METENIISYVLLFMGAAGTLITTINGIIRGNKKQDHDQDIEDKKQKLEEEERKADINSKITAMYNRIIDELEEKFRTTEEEIKQLRTDLDKALKLNTAYEKKIYNLQTAGMTLINAFEQAFKTREKRLSQYPDACAECNKADEAVLHILNEYKVLFQNRVDK